MCRARMSNYLLRRETYIETANVADVTDAQILRPKCPLRVGQHPHLRLTTTP